MIFSLRSMSKSRWRSSVVHDEENRETEEGKIGVEEKEEERECTLLTVWRKSLLLTCNGFTVIDSDGSLKYRVDNYIGRPGEVVLMDGYGKSILTLRRRKNLRLVDEWLIYEGEASNDTLESLTRRQSSSTKKQIKQKKQKPAYYVKRHLSILQANSSNNDINNVLAHAYMVGSKAGDHRRSHPAYVIEGSYSKRSCKVLDCTTDDNKKVVAEIRRKEAINGCASFGLEVFHLIVWPGFDPALAMSFVLLLDQMFT